jgi:hypothetical protein
MQVLTKVSFKLEFITKITISNLTNKNLKRLEIGLVGLQNFLRYKLQGRNAESSMYPFSAI